MNKKNYLLLIALCCAWLCLPFTAQGQVKIGEGTQPEKGAVLDLKKTTAGGYLGGILLPRVSVTDLGYIPPTFTDFAAIVEEGTSHATHGKDKSSTLEGLLVYNTNTATGVGTYIWDGDEWLPVTDGIPAPTFVRRGWATTTGQGKMKVYVEPGTIVRWYENATGGTHVGTGEEWEPADHTSLQGKVTYYAEAERNGAVSTTRTPVTFIVCGLYVGNGVWRRFMCHNLGADQGADPLVPSEALYGAIYKMGWPVPALTQATNLANLSVPIPNWTDTSIYPTRPTMTNSWLPSHNPCKEHGSWTIPNSATMSSIGGIHNGTRVAYGLPWNNLAPPPGQAGGLLLSHTLFIPRTPIRTGLGWTEWLPDHVYVFRINVSSGSWYYLPFNSFSHNGSGNGHFADTNAIHIGIPVRCIAE